MLEKILEKQINHFTKISGEVTSPDGKIPTYAGYVQGIKRTDREFENWKNPYMRALGTVINLPISTDSPMFEGINACRRLFNICISLNSCLKAHERGELKTILTKDGTRFHLNCDNHLYLFIDKREHKKLHSVLEKVFNSDPKKFTLKGFENYSCEFDAIRELFYAYKLTKEWEKYGKSLPLSEEFIDEVIFTIGI